MDQAGHFAWTRATGSDEVCSLFDTQCGDNINSSIGVDKISMTRTKYTRGVPAPRWSRGEEEGFCVCSIVIQARPEYLGVMEEGDMREQ